MKKFIAIVLIAICFCAVVGAQGLKEDMASRGEKLVMLSDGSYRIDKIAVAKAEVPAIQKTAKYELVGYNFIFALDGNTVEFKFIAAVGNDEIPVIAKAIMSVLPGAQSFAYPSAGKLVIAAEENLTEAQFDKFVADAKALIYNTIY